MPVEVNFRRHTVSKEACKQKFSPQLWSRDKSGFIEVWHQLLLQSRLPWNKRRPHLFARGQRLVENHNSSLWCWRGIRWSQHELSNRMDFQETSGSHKRRSSHAFWWWSLECCVGLRLRRRRWWWIQRRWNTARQTPLRFIACTLWVQG